jgi:hypothetical protein
MKLHIFSAILLLALLLNSALVAADSAAADAQTAPTSLLDRDLQTAPFAPHKLLGRFTDQRLLEVSGLAPAGGKGLFWALNDSNNEPKLFQIDRSAKIRRAYTVPFANVDWEDLAAFDSAGMRYLLVADVGDNEAVRPNIQLQLLREPRGKSVKWLATTTVTYPDGPRDCESMVVDTAGQRVLLLSKRDYPARLYSVPLTFTSSKQTASFLRTIRLPQPTTSEIKLFPGYGQFRSQPTSMAFNPASRELVVLTYRYAYLFTPDQHGPAGYSLSPQLVKIPLLNQAEAITFAGPDLYVAGEQINSPFVLLPRLPRR